MKYLVFRILTGGDLYTFSHMSFHDHLCHIDVAESSKAMVATGFGAKPEDVEVIGAGFVDFYSMGDVRCYGHSDSLNIHSRGILDSEVIRASMLKFEDFNPNKLEDVFGEFEQCRQANTQKLAALQGKAFVLTKRAGVIHRNMQFDLDIASVIYPFNIVKFRNIMPHDGQTYFVFDVNGEEYLFNYGKLSTLVEHNEFTNVLVRDDDPYAPDRMHGIVFKWPVKEYGIPVGADCSLKSIVFEDDHDPALVYVSVGLVKLTVNGEDREIEMKLVDLCDMIKNGREQSNV